MGRGFLWLQKQPWVARAWGGYDLSVLGVATSPPPTDIVPVSVQSWGLSGLPLLEMWCSICWPGVGFSSLSPAVHMSRAPSALGRYKALSSEMGMVQPGCARFEG